MQIGRAGGRLCTPSLHPPRTSNEAEPFAQEFYVQATRDARTDPLSHEQATQLIESFLRFPVQEITTAVMLAALATRERFGISYWDAAILEAGRALGCDVLLSEDLSEGEDYAGVRIENPFRGRDTELAPTPTRGPATASLRTRSAPPRGRRQIAAGSLSGESRSVPASIAAASRPR